MAKKRRRSNRQPRTDRGADTRTTERSNGTGAGKHQKRSPARTRAEKKELARERREQERKRQTRARFIRLYTTLVVISGVIVLAVFLIQRGDEPARPTTLPGELTTEAPWPPNTERLAERLEILGLPPAGETEHIHANLQVFVEGQPVTVPLDIGLDGATHASLHTHDEEGAIHVESQTARDFTLGEFFDVWGVRLSSTCIGGYCATGSERLQLFVDGEEVMGNKRDLVLGDENVIVLTFGTEDQIPDPIPATFDFASVAG